jgi:archaellum component FlaC
MTKPTAGGTKHNWLVEDLAAVVSDLRHTADGILRDLDNYQESREEVYLSSLATRIARLFQEIARITAVQAEMRALIDAAKNSKNADVDDLEAQVSELRAIVERLASMNGARHE